MKKVRKDLYYKNLHSLGPDDTTYVSGGYTVGSQDVCQYSSLSSLGLVHVRLNFHYVLARPIECPVMQQPVLLSRKMNNMLLEIINPTAVRMHTLVTWTCYHP